VPEQNGVAFAKLRLSPVHPASLSIAPALLSIGCSLLFACGSRNSLLHDAGSDAAADGPGVAADGATPPPTCDQRGEVPFLWARRVGGDSITVSVGPLSVAADGSMYVAGSFDHHLVLGPGEPAETALDSALDSKDVYVARFGPDGRLMWARRAGGTLDDDVSAAALSPDGQHFSVGGTFAGTVLFAPGEGNETQVQAKGAQDVYLATYADDGSLRWVKRIGGTGGTGTVELQQILAAADGSLRVLGTFDGTVTFGEGDPTVTSLASLDDYPYPDQFVARYEADGTLGWIKRVDGVGMDGTLKADGSLVVFGFNFLPGAVFARGEAQETTLDQAGSFRLSYDGAGTLSGLKLLVPSTGQDLATFGRAVLASDGSYHVAGSFKGSLTFGAGQPNEITLNKVSVGGTDADIFVARYDANDQLLWAKAAGGDLDDSVEAIAPASDGTLRLVGRYTNDITLGPGELHAIRLSGSTDETFLATYDTDGSILWAKNLKVGNSVVLLPDDSLRTAGVYGRPVTFGEGDPGAVTLPTPDFQDLFIAAYGNCP
jgi:hypothetical protein